MSIIVGIIAAIGVAFLVIAALSFALLAFGFLLSNTYMQIATALIIMAMCAYYFTYV